MEYVLIAALLVAGIGAVLWPLLGRDAGAPDPAGADDGMDGDRLAREVMRYRTALRAGTVCARCNEANPPGSRFCADCGRRLRGTEGDATAARA